MQIYGLYEPGATSQLQDRVYACIAVGYLSTALW